VTPQPASRSEGRSVLVLSEFPPPFGGLTVHSERLCETLAQRGWTVRRLSPPSPPGPGVRRLRRVRILRDQLRFIGRLFFTSHDLLHDHISTYWVGAAGTSGLIWTLPRLLALRWNRTPWVVTCGNGLLPAQLAKRPGWLRTIFRRLYAGAAWGIAKNEPIRAAFCELGLDERASVVGTFLQPLVPSAAPPLPNDVERFLSAHPLCVMTATFRFEPLYHLHDVVRAVGWVRSHARENGLGGQVGLLAFASMAEDPEGAATFRAALEQAGIAEHVLVLRDVDNALQVMERAALFVRATDFDGDSNSVKEAMMLGVRVLATDLPGRPPGVDLIDRSDLAELGPRVLQLLQTVDPDRLEANRAFIARDIQRNADDIVAVYERVCGG